MTDLTEGDAVSTKRSADQKSYFDRRVNNLQTTYNAREIKAELKENKKSRKQEE